MIFESIPKPGNSENKPLFLKRPLMSSGGTVSLVQSRKYRVKMIKFEQSLIRCTLYLSGSLTSRDLLYEWDAVRGDKHSIVVINPDMEMSHFRLVDHHISRVNVTYVTGEKSTSAKTLP